MRLSENYYIQFNCAMQNLSFKDFLEISLGIIAIISIIFRCAHLEQEIYRAIEQVKDDGTAKFNSLYNELAVHKAQCETRSQIEEYSLKHVYTKLKFIERKVSLLGGDDEDSN
jgi:hypothetical protein